MKKEETKSNSNEKIDEYLEVVNDLKLIDSYPNLSKYLVKPKERLEKRLYELLTA